MIFDSLKNYKRYENINNDFKKAFEFLMREDLKELSPGKYEIDGDGIFAFVQQYETKEVESKIYEVHKKYIDVQYMLQGEENMGFTSIDTLRLKTAYDEEGDAIMMDGSKPLYQLKEGEFFVFFPGEPHIPGIDSGVRREIKKIVVKIKV